MTFKVVTAIFNFYIPTTCMIFLYVRIFMAIKRRSEDIDRIGAYSSVGGAANRTEVEPGNDSLTEDVDADRKKKRKKHVKKRFPRSGTARSSSSSRSDGGEGATRRKGRFKEICVEADPDDQCQLLAKPKRRLSGIEETEKNLKRLMNGSCGGVSATTEFHKLAVMALPVIKGTTSSNSIADKKSCGADSSASKLPCSSLESLTVFEGITVRVEYISDNETASKVEYEECHRKSASSTKNNSHSHHIHCYRSKKATASSSCKPNDKSDHVSEDELCSFTMDRDNSNNSSGRHRRLMAWLRRSGSSTEGFHRQRSAVVVKRAANGNNPNAVLAKEKKAATQLGVIVGAFILCWLPYFTLFMVVAYCGPEKCVNQTVFTITIWFGYFNSTLNPILYPLCNANFKRAFKRMLRLSPAENYQVPGAPPFAIAANKI